MYGHSQLYNTRREALSRAEDPLPLHMTWHTTAKSLLAADVPVRIQPAILGHSDERQTFEYQHPDLRMLAEEMDCVQQYLDRGTEKIGRKGVTEGDTLVLSEENTALQRITIRYSHHLGRGTPATVSVVLEQCICQTK